MKNHLHRCSPEPGAYTLEVTGKGVAEVERAREQIPQGTPINIAFLGNESHDQRINAARVIRNCGFEPVPILSSRRLQSHDDLDALLGGLAKAASPSRFMLVGGDPPKPAGPFTDTRALLEAGTIQRHALRHVGIVAHPEGHPKVDVDTLWRSLKWKVAFLQQQDCTVEITTQLGFDASAILRWVARLRHEGIDCLVRVGIPGPADSGRLLRFARQLGVVSSLFISRGCGVSQTNPLHRVVPTGFMDQLSPLFADQKRGAVLFHLYPFGGIADAVDWMNDYLSCRRGR